VLIFGVFGVVEIGTQLSADTRNRNSLKMSSLDTTSYGDGFSSKELFEEKNNCQAFTFDDIILLPGCSRHYFLLLLFYLCCRACGN
jgi:hypothetical protein